MRTNHTTRLTVLNRWKFKGCIPKGTALLSFAVGSFMTAQLTHMNQTKANSDRGPSVIQWPFQSLMGPRSGSASTARSAWRALMLEDGCAEELCGDLLSGKTGEPERT